MASVNWRALIALAVLLVVAPALSGIIVRTKSVLTGRRGPPVRQLYYDLAKLLRKVPVYSTTTTWVFRAAPILLLVTSVGAACFLPLDGRSSVARFPGDLIAFAGLLGLGRFALVLAGLDTGSSFEGMGASREVSFASFAEPALFLCFIALALATGDLTLSGMFGLGISTAWPHAGAALVLVSFSLFILMLAENSRVPVDDPATHLELTMIHEVIVLDHSGPDLALILYSSALKLAVFAAMIASLLTPRAHLGSAASLALLLLGLILTGVLIGVVESTMARLRLTRVPQLLVGAGALSLFAIILLLR